MSSKHPRQIGTTPEAIAQAEAQVGKPFPPSFRAWLLEHNGLGIEGVDVYPVFDNRDPRKTWDSIVRNYEVGWAQWVDNFADEDITFEHLLPFADFGTGDYYCFDLRSIGPDGEMIVVHWSHETGETEFRAANFSAFAEAARRGDFDYD